ncbi:MAG: flagellar type III secretion system protein FliR [Hyphomicrobiales bacterium]|uniref:flagellar biosynthetic protein FliR n=1 Tax=Rhabdaerophilum calidifontis TaxID=2604328 RepID=UPI00123BE6E6|nr:flagellar biosynthetic protein FliR [Rhabdaerophilum calidifontis]MCA1952894.1 flagellar type III secretion system protein FliR [Hyphomicrobiales bacterium]MCA1998597.1 flagellar type III secretion system protein FliR [Hyphomicrobiales bacterium]
MSFSVLPEFALAFMLVFARVGTMMMLVPGLGERTTPMRIRLTLAILVALVMMPLVRPDLPKSLANLPAIANLLLVELMIGFTFGLASRFLMSSLQLAGVIIANQMGLAFTMSINPAGGDQGQSVALATFLSLLGISLILAAELHHVALMGIADSYRTLAPGQAPASGDAAQLAVMVAQSAFATGVQISAPFLVFGLVFNVGLGILSRMMPQLQVFFLALPASILLGTVVLIIVLSLMMDSFMTHVVRVFRELFPGLG